MKIVIIGGTAQSTPQLFRWLERVPVPLDWDLALLGRSSKRLHWMQRAVSLLTYTRRDVHASVHLLTELNSVLKGADVILIQVRIGGYRGRAFDETFTLPYGICGDEGLGPGGLAAAWRSWKYLHGIFVAIDEAAPQATTLVMSSPVGLLIRLSTMMCGSLHAWGICELPWTTLLNICAKNNLAADRVKCDYIGINHIGWFYRLASPSGDLIASHFTPEQSDGFPSKELVHRLSAIPTKYLRLHYEPEMVLQEQRAQRSSRGDILDRFRLQSEATFQTGSRESISEAIDSRPAPWYEHAIGPFLLALAGYETSVNFFLTRSNGALQSELSSDEVLEIRHTFSHGKLLPHSGAAPVPQNLLRTLTSYLTYERAAAAAVFDRDTSQLRDAVALHPWVHSKHIAEQITSAIIKQEYSMAESEGVS